MADSSHLHAIHCARRAAERAAAGLRRELGRGTGSLRAIACTAPFIGMFGTALPLKHALLAQSLPDFHICDCANGLGLIFIPMALSLSVAILASAVFDGLRHQLETLDFQMRAAILDLLDDLSRPSPCRG